MARSPWHDTCVLHPSTASSGPDRDPIDPARPPIYKPAMYDGARAHYAQTLSEIRAAGLYKEERVITTPQGATIRARSSGEEAREVLNFCANNYLGLSSHPAVLAAAKEALDTHGFGLSSVRFICGTQDLHKGLEQTISRFFGTDDAILYGSCFDANGGLFETLLGEEDAIISDALNHASIIDGIRLCKAERHRYPNGDLVALELVQDEVVLAAHQRHSLLVELSVGSGLSVLRSAALLQQFIEARFGHEAYLLSVEVEDSMVGELELLDVVCEQCEADEDGLAGISVRAVELGERGLPGGRPWRP